MAPDYVGGSDAGGMWIENQPVTVTSGNSYTMISPGNTHTTFPNNIGTAPPPIAFIPAPPPPPVIEHTYGCFKCLKLRRAPATPPRAGYVGFCGVCGDALSKLTCAAALLPPSMSAPFRGSYCDEPIRPEEPFCSSCGRDNTVVLMHWRLLSDQKLLAELEARGNVEEDGSPFRGVREE